MTAAPDVVTEAIDLAAIGRGLGDAGPAAQQVFRALLTALSYPGRLQTLPGVALAGLEPPGLQSALCATLLTLLDAETNVWLDPALAGPIAADDLRCHCGVRVVSTPAGAAFAVAPAGPAAAALWDSLPIGSDEAPQAGATLIVEVTSLSNGPQAGALRLSGPGVPTVQSLAVGGLDAGFWQARAALAPAYPCGIDLILCCGDTLVALPRTTRVDRED
jgi:alpha-D-ribose 1-methylphosphonate 5-triphosphate synthase subunit PhnH